MIKLFFSFFFKQALNNPMAQQLFAQNPQMRERMEQIAQNPAILQQALNNPMVQQMMNDPQAMQQAMQMMQGMGGSNPMGGMDPAMMQQMMQGMGGMGGSAPTPPTTGTTPPISQPPTQTPTSSQPPAKTEEELIAEAIQRSMEEK